MGRFLSNYTCRYAFHDLILSIHLSHTLFHFFHNIAWSPFWSFPSLGLRRRHSSSLQKDPKHPPPKHRQSIRKSFTRNTLSVLIALTTLNPVESSCNLPATFNPYFQAALNSIEETFTEEVISGLNDIGLGPVASLSWNDVLNLKENVFDPLFGDSIQRNTWINVTNALDVKAQLEGNLDAIIGAIPPELTVTCALETTDDLEEGELPYRFGMELELSGKPQPADIITYKFQCSILTEDSLHRKFIWIGFGFGIFHSKY